MKKTFIAHDPRYKLIGDAVQVSERKASQHDCPLRSSGLGQVPWPSHECQVAKKRKGHRLSHKGRKPKIHCGEHRDVGLQALPHHVEEALVERTSATHHNIVDFHFGHNKVAIGANNRFCGKGSCRGDFILIGEALF